MTQAIGGRVPESWLQLPPPSPETHRLPVVDPIASRLPLPSTTSPSDVMLIADAGAYGFSMASAYNLRALPVEGIIDSRHA